MLVVRLLLALVCVAATLSVAIAVWLDLRERRRWRAQVPPCWPPPGVDPKEAYADDLVSAGGER